MAILTPILCLPGKKQQHESRRNLGENKLKSLFTTLTKIGFPDKSAPFFDDTKRTLGRKKKNDI
jgi:hypothetical protein